MTDYRRCPSCGALPIPTPRAHGYRCTYGTSHRDDLASLRLLALAAVATDVRVPASMHRGGDADTSTAHNPPITHHRQEHRP